MTITNLTCTQIQIKLGANKACDFQKNNYDPNTGDVKTDLGASLLRELTELRLGTGFWQLAESAKS